MSGQSHKNFEEAVAVCKQLVQLCKRLSRSKGGGWGQAHERPIGRSYCCVFFFLARFCRLWSIISLLIWQHQEREVGSYYFLFFPSCSSGNVWIRMYYYYYWRWDSFLLNLIIFLVLAAVSQSLFFLLLCWSVNLDSCGFRGRIGWIISSSKVGFPERLSLSLSPCVGPEISGKTFVHSSLIIQGFLFIEPADIIFIPRKYVLNLVRRERLMKIASTVERKYYFV